MGYFWWSGTNPCAEIDMTVAPERLVLRAKVNEPLFIFQTYRTWKSKCSWKKLPNVHARILCLVSYDNFLLWNSVVNRHADLEVQKIVCEAHLAYLYIKMQFVDFPLNVWRQKMRWPGVEPGSTAWKATMLTVTPPTLGCQQSQLLCFC